MVVFTDVSTSLATIILSVLRYRKLQATVFGSTIVAKGADASVNTTKAIPRPTRTNTKRPKYISSIKSADTSFARSAVVTMKDNSDEVFSKFRHGTYYHICIVLNNIFPPLTAVLRCDFGHYLWVDRADIKDRSCQCTR